MLKLSWFVCCCAAGALAQHPSVPLNRTALIIGNTLYSPQYASLPNSTRDATDVSRHLSGVGFETQTLLNARADELDQAVSRFATGITSKTDVALVYYSGHGFQMQGENYLVPVSFMAQSSQEAQRSAYPLSKILDHLAHARVLIVILDACRDNPFRLRSFGFTRGLNAIKSPRGVMIVYATQPGKTASDGEPGKNGTFTSAFLRALEHAEWSLDEMLKWVSEEVYRSSGGMQLPWISSGLFGSVYLSRASGSPARGNENRVAIQLGAGPFPTHAQGLSTEAADLIDTSSVKRGDRAAGAQAFMGASAIPGPVRSTSISLSSGGNANTAKSVPPTGVPSDVVGDQRRLPQDAREKAQAGVNTHDGPEVDLGFRQLFERSVSRAQAGDLQGAERDVRTVLMRFLPEYPPAQLQLAAVLALQDRYAEAEEICRLVSRSDAHKETALLVLDLVAERRGTKK